MRSAITTTLDGLDFEVSPADMPEKVDSDFTAPASEGVSDILLVVLFLT